MNDWNPNVLFGLDRWVGPLIRRPGPASLAYDQETCHQLLKQIKTAHDKLRHISGIESIMASAGFGESRRKILPVAPRLLPQLEPLAEDDVSLVSKFGGTPNLVPLLRRLGYQKRRSYRDLIRSIWPWCGCCRRPMQFVGQFDLGLHGALLQAITRDTTSALGPDFAEFLPPGLGEKELYSAPEATCWWYVFLCPKSNEHWQNPGSDARIIVSAPVHSSDPLLPRRPNAVIAATRRYLEDIKRACGKESGDIPLVSRKITGFELGVELDPVGGYCSTESMLKDAIGSRMQADPEIFGQTSAFNFFGAPVSDQGKPMRPYCPIGHGISDTAVRMTPFLNFRSQDDMAHQIYCDFRSDCKTDCGDSHLFCKADVSCT